MNTFKNMKVKVPLVLGKGVRVVADRSRSKTIAGLVLLSALAAAGVSNAAWATGWLKLPPMVLKIGVGKYVIQPISFGKIACMPDAPAFVLAGIFGGAAGNNVAAQARCDDVVVAGRVIAIVPVAGGADAQVDAGVKVPGTLRCDFAGAGAGSVRIVFCG